MSNLQRYATFDQESYEAAQKEFDAGSGDILKLKAGTNLLRFMPAPVGHKVLCVTHNHFVEIPGQESTIGFNCPRHMAKMFCVVCQRSDQLKGSPNKADSDLGWQLSAKQRVYAYVIDRANPEAGPRVFAFGKSIYERLLEIRGDQNNGGDWSDPSEDGFDISILKKGEGKKTEYTVVACRDSSALGHDEWLDQLDVLPPLVTLFGKVPTDEEVREKLGGFDLGMMGSAPSVAQQGRGRQGAAGKRGKTAMDDADQSKG